MDLKLYLISESTGFWGFVLFAGIFTAAFFLLRSLSTVAAESYLRDYAIKGQLFNTIFMPIIRRLAAVNKMLYIPGFRKTMAIKLRKAGQPGGLDPDGFLAVKELGTLFGAALVGYLYLVTGRFSLTFLILFVTLGYFWPNLWLKEKIRMRQKQMSLELPYILDLMTVSVEAGLDFMRAVERVVETIREGELVKEFQTMLREAKIGRTRREVLRNLAERCETPDVDSFVSALVQADELGTSISRVLRLIANQVREKRAQQAEKIAAEAELKLLFPLVVVLLAVLLVVFGPIGYQIALNLKPGLKF